MNTLRDIVIALLELHVYITHACVYAVIAEEREKKPEMREEEEQEGPEAAGVVFQLPMYSCRDVFATVCTSHKFGSTGYI